MSKKETILVHLPSYRDPELIPTIKSALENAKYPKRIHFGICRQYHPEDYRSSGDCQGAGLHLERWRFCLEASHQSGGRHQAEEPRELLEQGR